VTRGPARRESDGAQEDALDRRSGSSRPRASSGRSARSARSSSRTSPLDLEPEATAGRVEDPHCPRARFLTDSVSGIARCRCFHRSTPCISFLGIEVLAYQERPLDTRGDVLGYRYVVVVSYHPVGVALTCDRSASGAAPALVAIHRHGVIMLIHRIGEPAFDERRSDNRVVVRSESIDSRTRHGSAAQAHAASSAWARRAPSSTATDRRGRAGQPKRHGGASTALDCFIECANLGSDPGNVRGNTEDDIRCTTAELRGKVAAASEAHPPLKSERTGWHARVGGLTARVSAGNSSLTILYGT